MGQDLKKLLLAFPFPCQWFLPVVSVFFEWSVCSFSRSMDIAGVLPLFLRFA